MDLNTPSDMQMSKCHSLLLLLLLLLLASSLSLLAVVLKLRSPEQSHCSLDRMEWDCGLLLGTDLLGSTLVPKRGLLLRWDCGGATAHQTEEEGWIQTWVLKGMGRV